MESPTNLIEESMKNNIEMVNTNAEGCNAEGDDKEIIKIVFNNTYGMTLIEAGIIICKDKTIDVLRDIGERSY